MLRDPELPFHLPRPFSVFKWREGAVSFLIKVVGRFTSHLLKKSIGQRLLLMGPLGNSFPRAENPILVAGGIGIAPLFYLKSFLVGEGVDAPLVWGVKGGDELFPWIERSFVDIATEDGSDGFKGTALDLLFSFDLERFSHLFSCGPVSMLRELKKRIPDRVLSKCYVSLESEMACGMGFCYGCSVRTRRGFKRVCREGPVFPLKEVVF